MKYLGLFSVLAGVQAHTIFQKVSVNGVDQGDLFGVRAPDSNYPITDVNDPNFACNTGITHQDSNLISIPQGASVGTWWDHAIGGAQEPGDPDSPIASSHKGPVQVYLAAVSDAVGSGTQGLNWFKVGSQGHDNGVWGVDNMISNNGWWTFTMPSCVPAGQYLMRAELVALHGAFNQGGAQFYAECAQVQVTGSGTSSPATVQFPGAYTATDPGILVSIYDGNGQPTMGGQTYTAPGPAVLDCSASGSGSGSGSAPAPSPVSSSAGSATPTTMATSTIPKATPAPAAAAAPNAAPATGSGSTAALMAQCGGEGWAGPTACASGTCTVANQWFSQCLP